MVIGSTVTLLLRGQIADTAFAEGNPPSGRAESEAAMALIRAAPSRIGRSGASIGCGEAEALNAVRSGLSTSAMNPRGISFTGSAVETPAGLKRDA